MDKISKKILLELSKNCRQKDSHIARKLRISKSTLAYKVNNMENLGIIMKFSSRIDYAKLGVKYARFAFNFTPFGKEHLDDILKYLKSHNNIPWIASSRGKYDLLLVLLYENIECMQFYAKMCKIFGAHIKYVSFSLLYKLDDCGNNFLFDDNQIRPSASDYSQEGIVLSIAEKKIINCLSQDGRMKIIDIAIKTGLSAKTVTEKIKLLEKEKIFLRHQVELDTSRFQLQTYHIFWQMIDSDEKHLSRFKQFLLDKSHTTYISQAIGESYIESQHEVANIGILYSMIDEASKKSSVQNSEILFIEKILKC